MVEKSKGRTFTVADLYTEAARMVREEMQAIKNEPLSQAEDVKTREIAKAISNTVLKEMKLI